MDQREALAVSNDLTDTDHNEAKAKHASELDIRDESLRRNTKRYEKPNLQARRKKNRELFSAWQNRFNIQVFCYCFYNKKDS